MFWIIKKFIIPVRVRLTQLTDENNSKSILIKLFYHNMNSYELQNCETDF